MHDEINYNSYDESAQSSSPTMTMTDILAEVTAASAEALLRRKRLLLGQALRGAGCEARRAPISLYS